MCKETACDLFIILEAGFSWVSVLHIQCQRLDVVVPLTRALDSLVDWPDSLLTIVHIRLIENFDAL